MWERITLKSNAKLELKYSYWMSFAVCLVSGILAGGSGGGASGSASRHGGGGPAIFAFFIVIAITIFLASPVLVGEKSFFIRAPYGDRNFSNLFSSFTGDRYMPIVKTMFITNLTIGLWSLLFIIPGIVKAYQYRFVAYLISDDPSLSPQQAMSLSRRMTDGEKFRMFVLDLSFIGWGILAVIAFGIGMFFLMPYVEATWAQLYFVLRTKVTTPGQPAAGPEF